MTEGKIPADRKAICSKCSRRSVDFRVSPMRCEGRCRKLFPPSSSDRRRDLKLRAAVKDEHIPVNDQLEGASPNTEYLQYSKDRSNERSASSLRGGNSFRYERSHHGYRSRLSSNDRNTRCSREENIPRGKIARLFRSRRRAKNNVSIVSAGTDHCRVGNAAKAGRRVTRARARV